MYSLTIIVPVYNEENFLRNSVERLINEKIDANILIVDDCSTDNSYEIAKRLEDKYEIISLLQNKNNGGKGLAIATAKQYIDSSHIVIHDADLEYFPEDLHEMIEISKKNKNSLILGSRFIGNKPRKNIYLRTFFANKLMSQFFSLVFLKKISDIATCYKLIPTNAFNKMKLKEKGFTIEVEILAKFIKTKNTVIESPISYEGRSYEEGKKIKLSDGFKYLFCTLKYRLIN